jgi:hypothetical protein
MPALRRSQALRASSERSKKRATRRSYSAGRASKPPTWRPYGTFHSSFGAEAAP